MEDAPVGAVADADVQLDGPGLAPGRPDPVDQAVPLALGDGRAELLAGQLAVVGLDDVEERLLRSSSSGQPRNACSAGLESSQRRPRARAG